MAKTILEQAKELLKIAQDHPDQAEALEKAIKRRSMKKQDAHMGSQGSAGPEAGAGAGNVVKDEVMPNGNQTAPSMSGPSNSMGAYGKGEGAPKDTGKPINDKGIHRRFGGTGGTSAMGHANRGHMSYGDPARNKATARSEANRVLREMHAMKKPNLPKCEGVQKALAEDWTPKFMEGQAFDSLEKSLEKARIDLGMRTAGRVENRRQRNARVTGKPKVQTHEAGVHQKPGTFQQPKPKAVQAHTQAITRLPKPTLKDEKNPDKEADARLGEQVEHDVEQHFKQNKTAEAKEGHSLTTKGEMTPKTSGHKPKIPGPVSTSTGFKNTGLNKEAMGKQGLKKDWIKSEDIEKALKEDFKPRYRK